ncbi:MAG: pyridoxine 5'-phosphate synthase [Gammaproteobacteria bacterium]|nr:pyridoxine 5'-phosphate synthase [Gammaproteobacteria bacterium]MDE0411639.1 pyridoxine 5'-phosphate synthase [Gammaproteobacteria bacterium]
MNAESGIRLGVNLDHVLTIRQARGTDYPDFEQAIAAAERAGADGITMHLREDRRHVQDEDVYLARRVIRTSMNLEMAATDEMRDIALEVRPQNCCIVPEKRMELTTEGGLDVIAHQARISDLVAALKDAGIAVSLFIEPDEKVVDAAARSGAAVIELHTGVYAEARGDAQGRELDRIRAAARHAASLGLVVNAGHGLHCGNVLPIARVENMHELNIGHSIVADGLFVGLEEATRRMKAAMHAEI